MAREGEKNMSWKPTKYDDNPVANAILNLAAVVANHTEVVREVGFAIADALYVEEDEEDEDGEPGDEN